MLLLHSTFLSVDLSMRPHPANSYLFSVFIIIILPMVVLSPTHPYLPETWWNLNGCSLSSRFCRKGYTSTNSLLLIREKTQVLINTKGKISPAPGSDSYPGSFRGRKDRGLVLPSALQKTASFTKQ